MDCFYCSLSEGILFLPGDTICFPCFPVAKYDSFPVTLHPLPWWIDLVSNVFSFTFHFYQFHNDFNSFLILFNVNLVLFCFLKELLISSGT